MPILDPPPNTPDITWPKLKDWLYKLWKNFLGLTFGADTSTYSAAIFASAGQADTGQSSLLGAYLSVPVNSLQAQNSSAQSIPYNTNTTVTNWTTIYTSGNIGFNATTGIITINTAGFYFVSSCLEFSNAAWAVGGTCQVIILQNSTQQYQGQKRIDAAVTTFQITGQACGVLKCAAGDQITIQAVQVSTSPNAVALANNSTNWANSLSICQVA